MPEESILTDEFLRQLIYVGEADILVSVPTYNNAASSIGSVCAKFEAQYLRTENRDLKSDH